MGTRASGSGAFGRLTRALAPLVAPLGQGLFHRCHVGAHVGRHHADECAGVGHRVFGRHIDGAVEVGLGRLLLYRLDVEDVAQVVVVDDLDELTEHVESLGLPRVEGIGLDRPSQVDAVLQVVHLGQVVTPALVDDLQHHVALDLAHGLGPTGHGLGMLLVVLERLLDDALDQIVRGGRLAEVLHA